LYSEFTRNNFNDFERGENFLQNATTLALCLGSANIVRNRWKVRKERRRRKKEGGLALKG